MVFQSLLQIVLEYPFVVPPTTVFFLTRKKNRTQHKIETPLLAQTSSEGAYHSARQHPVHQNTMANPRPRFPASSHPEHWVPRDPSHERRHSSRLALPQQTILKLGLKDHAQMPRERNGLKPGRLLNAGPSGHCRAVRSLQGRPVTAGPWVNAGLL